ncbi:hypothetical protein ACA910_005373 [Epithemia clementina (nom. ined.)]
MTFMLTSTLQVLERQSLRLLAAPSPGLFAPAARVICNHFNAVPLLQTNHVAPRERDNHYNESFNSNVMEARGPLFRDDWEYLERQFGDVITAASVDANQHSVMGMRGAAAANAYHQEALDPRHERWSKRNSNR